MKTGAEPRATSNLLSYHHFPCLLEQSMKSFTTTILACGLLVGAASAQQAPKEAQSTYEPRSTPGLGQKHLQKFVGDWDVQKVFYPATGEPVRVSGECRQSM